MSDTTIHAEEVPAYRQRGYFEVRNFRDQVVGLYHQTKGQYVNVETRGTAAYHPEMADCQGSFVTPDGVVTYASYDEYIDKIEAAFKRALAGWH